jgi:FkbM family methyltransferase
MTKSIKRENFKLAEDEIYNQLFVNSFMSLDKLSRYVYGINVYTDSIIDNFQIEAIIDDYYPSQEYRGVRVIGFANIPLDSLVVVASGGRTKTVCKRLSDSGIKHIDYFGFLATSKISGLREIVFNENFRTVFDENRARFDQLFSLLGDKISKDTFEAIVAFRYSLNRLYLSDFYDNEKNQYFEDFLKLQSSGEVFLDIGMFDGFTTDTFIKHCPDFKGVYGFEPGKINFQKCTEKFNSIENIRIYNLGLSNSSCILRFSENESGSHFDSNGEIAVQVDRLDSLNLSNGTFMKLDIEGGELEALEGARETILKFHPRIAVAVYHKPLDFVLIAELVLAIRADYTVFFRHYTETIYESVMFFIPNSIVNDRGL